MKILIPLVLAAILISTSCKKSSDSPDGGDISVLIIGKWKYTQMNCNSGFIFRNDGTWSFDDFSACGNTCGALPYGGTYQINGNTISSSGGLAQSDNLNGRVEIEGDVMKIYDSSTGNLIATLSKITGC